MSSNKDESEEKETCVYLISNACMKTFPNNTQSSFINSLPSTFPEAVGKQWQVALASLSLHMKFDYEYLPDSGTASPAFILVANSWPYERDHFHRMRAPTELSAYPDHTHIHIPHGPYTGKTFHEEFTSQLKYMKFAKDLSKVEAYRRLGEDLFLSKYDESSGKVTFGVFDQEGNETSAAKGGAGLAQVLNRIDYFLLVHTPLVRHFRMSSSNGYVNTEVNNNWYSCFEITKAPIETRAVWSTPSKPVVPDSLAVECLNANGIVTSHAPSKDLRIFTMDGGEGENTYFEHNFKTLEWLTLTSTQLSRLGLRLVDVEDRSLLKIRLAPTVSVAKLLLRQMDVEQAYRSSHVVRVSSKPNVEADNSTASNTSASFKIKLSSALPVTHTTQVALSACTIPNRFESFPLDETHRYFGVTLNSNDGSASGAAHSRYLTRTATTAEELAEDMNRTTEQFGVTVSVTPLGKLQITFSQKELCLTLHKHVAYFLGYGSDYTSVAQMHSRFSYMLFNGDENNLVYEMAHTPRFDLYIPKNIFLYADFVQSSIVGGEAAQLLKIIHVNKNEKDYVTSEFETLEFFPLLTHNSLTTMYMEMRDHTGKRICFTDDTQSSILSFIFRT